MEQFKSHNSYVFVYIGPKYHLTKGMGASVDKYRKLVNSENADIK